MTRLRTDLDVISNQKHCLPGLNVTAREEISYHQIIMNRPYRTILELPIAPDKGPMQVLIQSCAGYLALAQ